MKTVTCVLALIASPAAAQVVFEPPQAQAGLPYTTTLALGDVNEDGWIDAVAGGLGFESGGPIRVHLGQANCQFGPPQPISGGNNNVKRLVDLDGDGHLDLLTGFGWMRGDGSGGFAAEVLLNLPDHDAFPGGDADVLDFDDDGNLDVVFLNPFHVNQSPSLVIAYGQGQGSFDAPIILIDQDNGASMPPVTVRGGDVNGDGRDDIVYASGTTNALLVSKGGGAYILSTFCSGWHCLDTDDFELADLNGDGRDDIVNTAYSILSLQGQGLVTVQTFAPQPFALTDTSRRSVALGDIDGDGRLDAVFARDPLPPTNLVSLIVLRGRGDGTFEEPGVVVSNVADATESPRVLALADLDADSRLEAVVTVNTTPNSLSIARNHTYSPSSPFFDLGGALGGSNGYPIQLASGTLVAGQAFSFKLANGPPSGSAFHIVGLAALNAPFKSGSMTPFPHFVNGPLPLNPSGGITLAANWPAGGSGLTLWVQFWMPNGGGPAGFTSSSGLRVQVP